MDLVDHVAMVAILSTSGEHVRVHRSLAFNINLLASVTTGYQRYLRTRSYARVHSSMIAKNLEKAHSPSSATVHKLLGSRMSFVHHPLQKICLPRLHLRAMIFTFHPALPFSATKLCSFASSGGVLMVPISYDR